MSRGDAGPPATAGEEGDPFARRRSCLSAARQLEEQLARTPGSARQHAELARALALGGRPGEAALALGRAFRLDPADPDARKVQAAWREVPGPFRPALEEALAALAAGAPVPARDRLRQALLHAPHSGPLQAAYGRAMQELGCPEEARDAYAAAVALVPGDAGFRIAYGESLRIMGCCDEAVAQFQEAIRLAPDQAAARLLLARLLFRLDRVAEAECNAWAALELDPGDSRTRELVDRIDAWKEVQDCLARGLETRAGEALGRMLGLAPDDPRLLALQLLVVQGRDRETRILELYSTAIGHLAGNTEVYLAECDAGLHGDRTRHIFFPIVPVCNAQLHRMWERTLCVLPAAKAIFPFWNRIPSRRHRLPGSGCMRPRGNRDPRGLLHGSGPHLAFTPEEEERGRESLRAMGIPDGTPFVCIHARDDAYFQGDVHTLTDPDYHAYRNADVGRMVPAAEELVRRGYAVVRIGARQAHPLPAHGPGIVDYAMSPSRTEFMDIYLLGHCAFYLGGDSGVCNVAETFRRPVVFANWPALGAALTWNPMPFIFKRHWSLSLGRHLTVEEVFQDGSASFMESALHRQAGIRLEENTAQEILDLAVEADQRLRGAWDDRPGDQALQARFWEIFKRYASPYLHGVYRARVGAAFLRDHPELLD